MDTISEEAQKKARLNHNKLLKNINTLFFVRFLQSLETRDISTMYCTNIAGDSLLKQTFYTLLVNSNASELQVQLLGAFYFRQLNIEEIQQKIKLTNKEIAKELYLAESIIGFTPWINKEILRYRSKMAILHQLGYSLREVADNRVSLMRLAFLEFMQGLNTDIGQSINHIKEALEYNPKWEKALIGFFYEGLTTEELADIWGTNREPSANNIRRGEQISGFRDYIEQKYSQEAAKIIQEFY